MSCVLGGIRTPNLLIHRRVPPSPLDRSCPCGISAQPLKTIRERYGLIAVGPFHRSQSCASRAKSCAKFTRRPKRSVALRSSPTTKRLTQNQKVGPRPYHCHDAPQGGRPVCQVPSRSSANTSKATPGFTMATYQHVLPGMQAEGARTFASLLSPTDPTASTDFSPVESYVRSG
jgi:hypothetical protein